MADESRFDFRRIKLFLSSWKRPDRLCVPPTLEWESMALSPGIKRRGREADHSLPTSAKVKSEWRNISTPPYAFMDA